jgi:UDP-N-acetylglucosamine--N-acetylmuramyl-(pentapeptide) pyrophosphoryl-undecaprenol N-acetylglucosamine transferase
VHEPGAVAGISNRFLAAVADRVIVGMDGAFERKVATGWANRIPKPKRVDWLGTPVREEIANVPAAGRSDVRAKRAAAPARRGRQPRRADHERPGARGTRLDAGGAPPQVVHQAGQKLHEQLEYAYRHAHVEAEVVPFIDDMARRYAWCDVLICRSGAVTVAEIAAAGVASILFPLPWFVVDEQTANARFLSDRGAGITLEQLQTKPEQLAEILLGLDRDRLAAMAAKARALGKPDATRRCADACVELAHAA